MKDTFRQNKAITLIALVITIIVLLILAGVTIAMLNGENGILSRATETRATNAEAQADEQAKLAYMGVKTEIIAERVSNASYDAQSNAWKLGKIVKQELKGNEWTINPDGTDETVQGEKITMIFTDSSLNTTNHQIVYTIILPKAGETTVTLMKGDVNMATGGSGSGSGSSSGSGSESTSPVVFKSGGTTVETPSVGDDVEIGDETFRVIKITGKKVTALPKYNLDLNASPIKQATASNYESAGGVPFSSVESPTWSAGININLDSNTNNVKTPIANYQSYLQNTLKATNVEAKIRRFYSEGASEEEFIGDVQGEYIFPNGGDAYETFWTGSSQLEFADYIMYAGYSAEDPWQPSHYGDTQDDSYMCGIRPVIIITLP